MGWMETRVVDERMRFVMAVGRGEESFAAICRRFGICRRIGYKWLGRYEEEGVEGLVDQSRAPRSHPQALTAQIAERCLSVRRIHPTWGPVKVRDWLEKREPTTQWPATSTIGALFDREGLTVKRRLRRRSPPSSVPFAHCGAANDIWCIDFKGWFLTGDGHHCEPLTLADAHSRYLLRCQAMSHTDTEHVWPVLNAAFHEFGLPRRLRSDNGPPFASRGAGGLSRLAVKVIKAGRCAGTHRARQTATERPARAAAPDAAAGHRQATSDEPARPARTPAQLPAHLQRGAAPSGARQRYSVPALRVLAAQLRRRPTSSGVWRWRNHAAGAP